MDFTGIITNLGIGSGLAVAICYFFWHVLTKTIPSLVQAFRDEMGEERKANMAALIDLRADHHLVLNMDRDQRHRMHDENMMLLRDIKQRVDLLASKLALEVTQPESVVVKHQGA